MILQSAKDYLANTSSVRIAHLVEIELAGTDGVFDYITDYMSDVQFGTKIYTAGKVTKVGSITLTQGLKNYSLNVSVAGEFQEELDKGSSDQSYEGRVINVYKAYLDEAGEIIPFDPATNGPQLFFRGKISRITIAENITKGSSVVTWACVGLLADFEKVNGRLTEDASHRGLVSGGLNNLPIPSDGAKKEAYKTDTGFLHANQTVSTSIKYISKEKEYYLKKSWGGLKTKLREREVEVEREVSLNTSLTAKYLPVVYGVRRVPGIPVFLDVLKSDPSTVYCVYAVCEGEIDAFLNVYVDGISVICGDLNESNTSGVCMGNMANGDTLAMYTYPEPAQQEYRRQRWYRYKYDRANDASDYSQPASVPTNPTVGTSHGDVIKVAAEKGPITFTFYHGKSDQTPNQILVNHAAANNFMIQGVTKRADGTSWGADYWANSSVGVSGAALLDTAYVVAEFKMSADRESLPNLEFVVSGKSVPVYTSPVSSTVQYTLNPVWHLLEYLTNPIYGAGISPSVDLDISSFISVANDLEQADTSYQFDFVTYWRYIGWLNNTYSRARMQCNTLITTEDPVTKVVESILEQFDGSLAIIGGINTLSIENDYLPVTHIDISEVIGSVSMEEIPNKDKWNSINASIIDPAMDWSTNQINFFNSTYLAEDNNIRKKGRAIFSHITNYYTARAWAERQLNKSRFGRVIRFTTYYKYSYLKPNDNITFSYPRFNYDQAKFRVTSVEVGADGLVRLTLRKYDSSIFSNTGQPKTEAPGGGAEPTPIVGGIGHVLLPSGLVDITPPIEGVPYALIYWDTNTDPSILRYEVKSQEDPNFIVQALPNNTVEVAGQSKNYALYPVLPSTTYTIKVQTLTKSGSRSPYSLYTFTTPAVVVPSIVPKVRNFVVINISTDGTFTGPNLTLQWTTNINDYADTYNIQILDPNTQTVVFETSVGFSVATYTFTLSSNMSSYAIQNGGAIGAYRNLAPRIRAVKNGSYSDWSTLNNGE